MLGGGHIDFRPWGATSKSTQRLRCFGSNGCLTSQHALATCTPAWPMWMEMTSRLQTEVWKGRAALRRRRGLLERRRQDRPAAARSWARGGVLGCGSKPYRHAHIVSSVLLEEERGRTFQRPVRNR